VEADQRQEVLAEVDVRGADLRGEVLHHAVFQPGRDRGRIALLQARDQRDRDALGGWARARQESPDQPTLQDSVDALHQVVVRNAGQPELVRLYSMLRDPAAVDLVREWDRAMDTIVTSLTARSSDVQRGRDKLQS
jgi:hypothetical protein